ncbi:hypothetical protein CPB85DRAFT_1296995 [Mucidula mucida]|nr:hypothetical protein CPB85DRAFT_1296995 [Mucidula mucida]
MRPSDEDGKVNVFNLRDPLYIVSQVCRTWRTASHRHARLWSQIVIKTSKVRLQAPRDGVLRLQKVLERARSAPLDFTFYSNSETTRLSIALLSLLTEYSQQWRSVAVRWLTPKEARPLELVCGRVPELQTVTLSFTRGGKDVKPTDLISAFQFAPKLSQVALHDFPLGQVSLDSSVKQNLQSLNLTYPCGEEDMANGFSLSKFLCEYPSLKKFYLFRCRESTARAWPTPCGGASRTIYAGLTSVCAVEGGSLNRISLPSLVHLEVGSYTETLNPGVVPCVISLLQHSRCRLATLDLCAAAWDEESLRVLLALVPDLDALTITFESMQGVDDAVRILTHCLSDGSPEPKYVPRLKVLYIDLAFMGMKWSFVDERFLDMVFIRADWGLLVVDFFVEYWGIDSVPVLTEDDLRRWDDLKKAGLIHVDPPHY